MPKHKTAMPKTKTEARKIISLRTSDVLAPATALLTVCTKDRLFDRKLLRQLLQSLAASLFEQQLSDLDRESFMADFQVSTQLLGDLLDSWADKRWLTKHPKPEGHRNAMCYQVTPKGAAAFMAQIAENSDALMDIRLDRLVLALFLAKHFPVKMLEARVPGLGKQLGRPSTLSAHEWDWKVMRKTYVSELRKYAATLREQSKDLAAAEPAISVLKASLGPKERPTAKLAELAESESASSSLDFYFPGLIPFRNQRDPRPIEELGSQPLLNFYDKFDDDFVRWHLFEGFADIGRSVYAPYADHVDKVCDILEAIR